MKTDTITDRRCTVCRSEGETTSCAETKTHSGGTSCGAYVCAPDPTAVFSKCKAIHRMGHWTPDVADRFFARLERTAGGLNPDRFVKITDREIHIAPPRRRSGHGYYSPVYTVRINQEGNLEGNLANFHFRDERSRNAGCRKLFVEVVQHCIINENIDGLPMSLPSPLNDVVRVRAWRVAEELAQKLYSQQFTDRGHELGESVGVALETMMDARCEPLVRLIGTARRQTYSLTELYFRIRSSVDILTPLADSNANVLVWWARRWHTSAVQSGGSTAIDSPGQIITAAKRHMNLEGAAWRKFLAYPISQLRINEFGPNDFATKLCRLLAKIDAPMPSATVVGSLRFHFTDYRGAARRASLEKFQHMIALLARASVRMQGMKGASQRQLVNRIPEVVDYLNQMRSDHVEVRARTWGGLLKRSDRWHRDMAHQRLDQQRLKLLAKGPVVCWNSLVPATEIGEVRLTPLTSPLDLVSEGTTMSNCVASYSRQCAEGNSRIFHLETDHGLTATCEIMPSEKSVVMQTLGKRNRSISARSLLTAANEIARAYSKAWKESPESERHVTYEVGSSDGLDEHSSYPTMVAAA